MSLSLIPRSIRDLVLARDAGRCTYCGLHQWGQAAVFHIDHILPKSKGGPTAIENLTLQCTHCSLHKSNATHAIDPHSLASVPLFHPIQNHWSDHFQLLASGELTGLTQCGRATIDKLQMNSDLPLAARRLQIQLEILIPSPPSSPP